MAHSLRALHRQANEPKTKTISTWKRSKCRSRARVSSQRVACDAGYATSGNKTTFETHCEANEVFPPSISAQMLTITVCTHADRAERASMVSIRTEIRYVKTLTIVVIVRVFEQWRRDASENPMRAVNEERLASNVFVGESGDRLSTLFPAPAQARSISRCDHHICFDSGIITELV